MTGNKHSVEIRDLELRFGDVTVLQQLNLDIHEGEFLVLLGSSGCGKSTLLNCIAGLLDVTPGAAFTDPMVDSGDNVEVVLVDLLNDTSETINTMVRPLLWQDPERLEALDSWIGGILRRGRSDQGCHRGSKPQYLSPQREAIRRLRTRIRSEGP